MYVPRIRFKPTRDGVCLPLFMVQMPQKTYNRLKLGARLWEMFLQCCLGIDFRQANLLDTFIDLKTYQQILTLGMRVYGAENLLRWYVEDTESSHMGPVGMATAHAPTVREGLQVWQRYAAITAPHIRVSNLDYRNDRIIRFQMLENLGDVHVLYQELCLFVTRRVLQDLTGGRAQVRLRFSHQPMRPLAWYVEAFGVEPEISPQGPSLVIEQHWLEHDNERYTPLLYQRALEECGQLEENFRHYDCIGHRVRMLLVEGARRSRFYNLDQVAEKLHMSTRTLTRRLRDDGTSFRDLQCEVRLEQAKRQLQETRLPIKTICSNAGFTNVSAFSRAFRKYTSFSPSDYRQNT